MEVSDQNTPTPHDLNCVRRIWFDYFKSIGNKWKMHVKCVSLTTRESQKNHYKDAAANSTA